MIFIFTERVRKYSFFPNQIIKYHFKLSFFSGSSCSSHRELRDTGIFSPIMLTMNSDPWWEDVWSDDFSAEINETSALEELLYGTALKSSLGRVCNIFKNPLCGVYNTE